MYECSDCGKQLKTRGSHKHPKNTGLANSAHVFDSLRDVPQGKATFYVSGDVTSGGVSLEVVERPEEVKIEIGQFTVAKPCRSCGYPNRYYRVETTLCSH